MEQVIVTRKAGGTLNLYTRSSATSITRMEQRRALMSEDIIEMSVESATAISFAIGDTITVYGRTYTLNALPRARKGGMRQFGYDLTWEGRQYDLLRAAFLDTASDGVSLYADFSITGDLESLMNILINNLDRVYGSGKWILGICPETETLTLTFANDNCLAVLQSLCTEENFNVEFEITEAAGVCTIDLRVLVGVTHAETYEYGRGKGLYGLQRQTVSNKNIVTRLYAFGAAKNLRTDYRGYSQRLKLPSVDHSYIEDATALATFGMIEAVKTFEEIFPHRTGTVTSLGDTIYKFVDTGMDFDLNAVDGGTGDTLYLMNGTSAKIHFNTGALAGYEFELSTYNHSTRTFTIKRLKDERDQEFPDPDSEAFRIAPGDEYVLIDIYLPDSYVTAAEAELLAAAEAYLAENCQPRVNYGLTFDEIHLARYAEGAAELFAPGDNIHVKDTDIGVDKIIRVRALVRDLMADYRYSLDLSDAQHPSILQRLVAETIDNTKVIAMNKLNDPARARRNWRATQELMDMVFDPDGYFDGTRIKPESIETMMLSVGTRSQQLTLSAVIEPNYGGDPEDVNVTGGALAHYAIEDDIRLWTITGGDLTLSSTASMYIYARCEKVGSAGTITFTTDQITVDEDPSYYYFLLGVLHAASDGVRWISLTYGATAINGRYIRTGRIISQDGLNYFDLDQNEFKVGDASSSLDWNVTAAGQLTLKGALVQSGAGTTSPLPSFRGAYSAATTYYRGDEVTNAGESWLYINAAPASGQTPAEGAYWTKKAAAGADGADGTDGTNGNYIEYQYAKNGSTTTPPAIVPSDLNPTGWSVTPPSTGTGEYLWMTKATKDYAGSSLISNWTTPVRIKGETGAAGAAGAIGPSTLYRGAYNAANTYYGTTTRVDVVYYSGSYYVARTDAPGGSFSGIVPTNTSYWNSYGANFESIATGLLFAELAYVDNLGVRVLKGTAVPVGDLAGTVTNITPNISLEPEWDPDTYYNVDDKCSDSGINYVCLIANIGEPLTLPYWSTSTPQPQKRKDRITLSGTSGSANITCDSITRRIYYSSEGLTQTAADFVALYAADWTPGNVVLTSSGDSLYLESTIAGVDFTGSTTIVNWPNFYRGSIVIRGNEIWEDDEDNDIYGVVAINMRGYNGGYTRPRILVIGDGQGGLLAKFGPGNLVTLNAAGISLPNLPGSNPGGGAANILWVDGSGYVRVGS